MRKIVEFEDIEEMRRQEGIEDAQLWQEIDGLRVGDFVRLTPLTTAKSFETVLVRITSIQGVAYRGKFADKPVSAELLKLKSSSLLAFTASHIHSVVKRAEVHAG